MTASHSSGCDGSTASVDGMKRRQVFMTESYYSSMSTFFRGAKAYWQAEPLEGNTPEEGACRTSQEIKMSAFMGMMLEYTAGAPISALPAYLERLIEAYEQYQHDLARQERSAAISPLNLVWDASEYQEFVQVVSLCVLLQRPDLLQRFVGLTDRAGFHGQDVLYEDLLKKALPGRVEVEAFYHEHYRPLIESVYAQSEKDASRLLDDYCNGWYVAFASIPNYWHDTHLTMSETDGAYFGYWALEAAAIAYLYGIDDSAITNMVYPRDLVEHARTMAPISPV